MPDYENVSQNFRIRDSIQLLATSMNRGVSKVEALRSALEADDATGSCDCTGTELDCAASGESCTSVLHPPTPKGDCVSACQAAAASGACNATGESTGWQMDDLYLGAKNVERKALSHVKFLDGAVKFVTGPQFGNALRAAGNAADAVQSAADFVNQIGNVTDKFTEGFHLGAYSRQRPQLWYCVPRAGSGVYAPMTRLGGGRFSIGSSYVSGLAAKKVNGVFSMGGATLEANGRTYTFLPGAAYNVQIDGFRLFDRDSLLGIQGVPFGSGGLSVHDTSKADVFNLVDADALSGLDADGNGTIAWSEVLYRPFFPVPYTSVVAGHGFVWPRSIDRKAVERTSTAVFGAGLDMNLEMKPFEPKLPAIPLGGVATVQPTFTLRSGIAWHNQHDLMLKRVRDALKVPPGKLTRDMHAMQAPDSSRDVGVSAHVDPRIGAELNVGVRVSKFLTLGAFASVNLGARLEPRTLSDTVDTNSALATYLRTINPPTDAVCDPILRSSKVATCTNPHYACAGGTGGQKVSCESYGRCVVGSSTFEDESEASCSGRKGAWVPYSCVERSEGEIVGWQGPGCNPLSSVGTGPNSAAKYIGLTEDQQRMLDGALAAGPQGPQHSIFTYAASDLTFKALLDAAFSLEARVSLFGYKRNFTLFHWADTWNLGSTNKTWLQMGLEARYETDEAPAGDVFNHQPSKVKRYSNPTRGDWSLYSDAGKLVNDWCFPSVKGDTTYDDYKVPTNTGVVQSVNDLTTMGKDLGERLWQDNQVCIGGERAFEWLAGASGKGGASLSSKTCKFTSPDGTSRVASCDSTEQTLAEMSGCANVDARVPTSPRAPLTSDGASVSIGELLLADAPTADVRYLRPEYDTPAWRAWISTFGQCLASSEADKVTVSLLCGGRECKPARCCGDGVLEAFEACDPSVPGSPACTSDCRVATCGDGIREGNEQCDDGNTRPGDGCDKTCQIEQRADDSKKEPGQIDLPEPSLSGGAHAEEDEPSDPLVCDANQLTRAEQEERDALAAEETELKGTYTVLFQGKSDFLKKCDSYSKSVQKVVFFCNENPGDTYVDTEAWVAIPKGMLKTRKSTGYCNKKAKLCKGNTCVTATIVERSETASRFEGSAAVMTGLGLVDGGTGNDSFGWGGDCTWDRSAKPPKKATWGTVTGVKVTLDVP